MLKYVVSRRLICSGKLIKVINMRGKEKCICVLINVCISTVSKSKTVDQDRTGLAAGSNGVQFCEIGLFTYFKTTWLLNRVEFVHRVYTAFPVIHGKTFVFFYFSISYFLHKYQPCLNFFPYKASEPYFLCSNTVFRNRHIIPIKLSPYKRFHIINGFGRDSCKKEWKKYMVACFLPNSFSFV